MAACKLHIQKTSKLAIQAYEVESSSQKDWTLHRIENAERHPKCRLWFQMSYVALVRNLQSWERQKCSTLLEETEGKGTREGSLFDTAHWFPLQTCLAYKYKYGFLSLFSFLFFFFFFFGSLLCTFTSGSWQSTWVLSISCLIAGNRVSAGFIMPPTHLCVVVFRLCHQWHLCNPINLQWCGYSIVKGVMKRWFVVSLCTGEQNLSPQSISYWQCGLPDLTYKVGNKWGSFSLWNQIWGENSANIYFKT